MSRRRHLTAPRSIARRQRRFLPLLLLAGLVLAGCPSLMPAGQTTVRQAQAPAGATPGLGASGVYVRIEGTAGRNQGVAVPVAAGSVRWLDPASLRLARWQEGAARFVAMPGGRYDAKEGVFRSAVGRDGLYTLVGTSRLPAVSRFQRQLCRDRPFGIARNERIFQERLCLVILCAPFDAGAWEHAWSEQGGAALPPGELAGHFGDLCDRCLGAPGISGPLCEVGVPEPRDPVRPPVLEHLPSGIDAGGRAVAIAVDPGEAARMVVASETGGLFRTADGGATWSHVSGRGTFDFTDVQYAGDSDVVVATARRDTKVASGGGIWRSDDAGATWNQVAVSPPAGRCADGLGARALDRVPDTGRLWAGTECGAAFSDDRGASWNYLPAVPGYDHDRIYAVVSPATGRLRILTDEGVKVSDDGGASWSVSNSGLPSRINRWGHNQLAVSPFDPTHLLWSFSYWLWDDRWEGRNGLYVSADNGATWSPIIDQGGISRPPIIRLALGSPVAAVYTMYHSNGGCQIHRATVSHGSVPSVGAWTDLTVDHCDVSDVAFAPDGRSPVLMASDGGLHATADGGLTWTFTGGGAGGYNALQITEVTGQLHGTGVGSDLYYGTQDNNLRASPDNGASWPGDICCEGFFLGVPRQPLPADETRVTGVTCAGCRDFITEPIFRGYRDWTDPPADRGNPRLVEPGTYLENTEGASTDLNVYQTTPDLGRTWDFRFSFPEAVRTFPQIARDGASGPAAALIGYRQPGEVAPRIEAIGIVQANDLLGSSRVVVSYVPGIGGLPTFPTMFAWYRPFGVHPENPSVLMVPDLAEHAVRVTPDGGATWTTDATLTGLVTDAGTLRFDWDRFGQVSAFGFNPDCPDHVLVGTRQGGILETTDAGANWRRVPGSRLIPRISSFYFSQAGEVLVSSYGRGLWRLRSPCPGAAVGAGSRFERFRPYPVPILYVDGIVMPLGSVVSAGSGEGAGPGAACDGCTYYLAEGGEITDVRVDGDGRVLAVQLSAGELRVHPSDGPQAAPGYAAEAAAPAFTVARAAPPEGKPGEAISALDRQAQPRLNALLGAGNDVRGLLVDGGDLRGLVVAAREVGGEDLPQPKQRQPFVHLNVSPLVGIPAQNFRQLEITLHGVGPEARLDAGALKVTLDGEPASLGLGREVADGAYRFVVRPGPEFTPSVGGHVLVVEGQTADGTFRDVTSFHLTVHDEADEGTSGEEDPRQR